MVHSKPRGIPPENPYTRRMMVLDPFRNILRTRSRRAVCRGQVALPERSLLVLLESACDSAWYPEFRQHSKRTCGVAGLTGGHPYCERGQDPSGSIRVRR